MSQPFRDALAWSRLARIKQRSARMQVMAAGQRTEERLAAAMLAADAQLADEGPGTAPDATEARRQ